MDAFQQAVCEFLWMRVTGPAPRSRWISPWRKSSSSAGNPGPKGKRGRIMTVRQRFLVSKLVLLGAVIACVSACATTELNDGLQAVLGKPIDVLVSDWGYPSDQREIMGHTIYIWNNQAGVMAMPMYGGGAYAAPLECTVQVMVDSNNIITHYQWSGNNGGCKAFADRIQH